MRTEAAPSSILRLVFERVGLLIAAGLALGLAGSLWAAHLVEALLFHLEPRDPVTFGGAAPCSSRWASWPRRFQPIVPPGSIR